MGQQSTFVTKRGSSDISVLRPAILYAFKLAKVWKCHVSKYEIKQEQEAVLNAEQDERCTTKDLLVYGVHAVDML